ncbi:MAG: NfeD family protein [Pseudomonadota bacterium]
MTIDQFSGWLIVAAILLLLELLGFSGFLLGIAIAAGMMALIVWELGPLPAATSALSFAGLAILCTLIYWRGFKPFNNRSDAPLLNDPYAAQIGRRYVLRDAIDGHPKRVFLGDSRWAVATATGEALSVGTDVVVTARHDDGHLLVSATRAAD